MVSEGVLDEKSSPLTERDSGAPAWETVSFIAYHLPWANVSTTPFRLYKHMVNEGGISTPFIARWSEKIKQQGTITHQVGHLMDIMATCLDAAAIPYPETYKDNKIIPLG